MVNQIYRGRGCYMSAIYENINKDTEKLVEPLLDTDDIARIFKCSPKKARAIMSQNNFPVMLVGREPRVVPSKLHKWLDQNYNKEIKAM